jgi:mannose-6-phosphate isomerase-like protein (cupin superfamily)
VIEPGKVPEVSKPCARLTDLFHSTYGSQIEIRGGYPMPADFINILDLPELEIGHSKKVLFSSDHFHTWVHGDYPGTKGPMHKHTADQQFYCVKGECTFHFPKGSSRKLTPGMLVTIPAGQLYQLDNTGDQYMILLGARAEAAGKPRFANDDKIVTVSDYALSDLDKITAAEEKKARARMKA